MRNKRIKQKDEAQIGNFIIKFTTGKFNFVRVSSVASNWSLNFREDNLIYTWIKNELNVEDGKEILHLLFSFWYSTTNGIPDQEFIEDSLKSYSNSIKRMQKALGNYTEGEHDEALQDVKSSYSPQSTKSNKN